jgi:predicted glycosyl hydrolase (DUF1957 family)
MAHKIRVGLLLHFYQPWWQFREVLARICDECYRPVLRWVEGRHGFCFSANFNWSLIEVLLRDGHNDVVALFRDAVDRGKIELFSTAAHHPILPLLDDGEIARQIARDDAGKKSLCLTHDKCSGFYLPEYAWTDRLAKPLLKVGCNYTVVDDLLFAAQHRHVPFNRLPTKDGLAVFLRSRKWGKAISFGEYDFDRMAREFPDGVNRWFGGSQGHVVLATDAETFGHHHRHLFDHLLKPMLEQWGNGNSPVEFLEFEKLYDLYHPHSTEMAVPPGSWSTEASDFVSGDHFPLWNSPNNIYHRGLWKLIYMARRYGATPGVEEDCLKLLSSCFSWQVSGRPNFNPSLMMIGAKLALDIINRAADDRTKQEGKETFEELCKLPGISR